MEGGSKSGAGRKWDVGAGWNCEYWNWKEF